MIFYTISRDKKLIDSISEDFFVLRNKFPTEIIYVSYKPITSIYVHCRK